VKDSDGVLLAVHWSRADDVLRKAVDISVKDTVPSEVLFGVFGAKGGAAAPPSPLYSGETRTPRAWRVRDIKVENCGIQAEPRP
jgi:hypothetical protein